MKQTYATCILAKTQLSTRSRSHHRTTMEQRFSVLLLLSLFFAGFLTCHLCTMPSLVPLFAALWVYSTYSNFLLSLAFVTLASILVGHFSTFRYPAEIPRVREPAGKRYFGLKTRLAYYTNAKGLYQDAYEKVSDQTSHLESNRLTKSVLQARQDMYHSRPWIPKRNHNPSCFSTMGHLER